MSRNASKTGKGGLPKTPKDNQAGNATGSSIRQYLAKGGSPGGAHQEIQKSSMADKKKKGSNAREEQTPDHSREDLLVDNTLEASRLDEQRQDPHLPSKNEMAEMLKTLETSIKAEIKAEINRLRTDLGHLLTRVEGVEDKLDKQEREIFELKEQLKTSQQNQIKICYRMEDQENRDRRQNLRLRGIPENRGEDLRKVVAAIFNPLLELEGEAFPKIERVHRVGRLDTRRTEKSRDIIVRFRFYEDKENIWIKLKGHTPLLYEEARIQVFADPANTTLARRRHLKPLLERMKIQNIKYTWGFPACLIGSKDGRSARLRFPGELEDFCEKLDMQVPPRLDWSVERWIEMSAG